ncbi:hypothetical protein C8F04DRAFT_1398720 [Mycena alexandri]|uniref:Uncharacterized protein n=1 Tax=Mycena alexandri TaxID=1745969 RepID=A0AAD6WZ45_9AGAR|nr:hypothetical protein C8F04DRAFT_1398720 [Mycena alexandri]
MPAPPSLATDTGPVMPRESHTLIQHISGGIGGNGGTGQQGGSGGAGQGPRMTYNIGTVDDFGIHIHTPGPEQQQQMNAMERAKITEWLSPINFFLRQADISQSQQKGTGGWLLADPQFQQWESGSGKTLWCHGIPGVGKTVLVSMVVSHLGARFEDNNIGVACAYLDYKEADDQTPVKVLAGLWRQLILGRDIGSAKILYQRHHEKGTPPTLDEVSNVLHAAIREFSQVYIVIDAVDEYPETQRQILLEYITMLGPAVNLMITSRPHIAPDSTLPNLDTLEIRVDEGDIGKYVDAQIRMSRLLKKHVQNQPDLQKEIHSKIICTVDGMFLLAKLHMDSLSTKGTVKSVREALKALPKTLNDRYDDAMRRIKEQNEDSRNIANSTLAWVANTKRRLTALELQTALAIEPGTKALDKDNMLDIDTILSACAGLVIVDEQISVVRLVHYTTQEYLDSIQPQQFPDVQTEITCSLLTYLAFDESLEPDLDIPFLEYSQYCLMHAAGPPEHVLNTMILGFLARAPQLRLQNLKRQPTSTVPPWSFDDWPYKPSPLWIAAAANLLETARSILHNGATFQQGSDCSEILVASYYGHLQMVKLLIKHGSDVNVQGGYHGTALYAASINGHKDVVQLLIEHGADVNGYNRSTSQVASDVGWKDMIDILREFSIPVNMQGGHHGSALQAASVIGHQDIAQLLIDHGADVNVQGGYYGSALQAASVMGHQDIVQLLIKYSADVNVQGGYHGSALQAALDVGHNDIVHLLIEHGAGANVHGSDTTLQAVGPPQEWMPFTRPPPLF